MENFFSRYRNETVLVAILFIQIIALATQVRVPGAARDGSGRVESTSLIRVWAVGIVSPFQRLYVHSGLGLRNLWHNYIDLRGLRQQNARIQQELDQMRLEQSRIHEDAEQGRRLQALLGFKEQFIGSTLAAQVIGTSGTDLSRVIYIDRGARDGIQAGMAVITPDGVVGKISRADRNTSQVLLITDPSSGAGVIVERLRLNGVLKGSASGYAEVQNIMADEKIEPGDRIITTGGDHVFPKGLAVGTVLSVSPDSERDPFLAVKVKPAVNLAHLEEVLVVTELKERGPTTDQANVAGPTRAADVLAERLPTYKTKAQQDLIKAQKNGPNTTGAQPTNSATATSANPSRGQPTSDTSKPPAAGAMTRSAGQSSGSAASASSGVKEKTQSSNNSASSPNQNPPKASKLVPVKPAAPAKSGDTLKEPPR